MRALPSFTRQLIGLLTCGALLSCRPDATTTVTLPPETDDGWSEASHGSAAAPNYAEVFADDVVRRLDIQMTAAQWSSVRANMTALWGFDFGARGPGFAIPRKDPDYIDVTLRSHGRTWSHVGFRLKGNSSLGSAWLNGNYKLPFRLNFDRFEDRYPEIRNQRFHGFKELSMSPNFRDQSLIREKTAADIFRLAGVPAARTAFYRVYIDFGEGARYVGVYTMVEIIEDTMLASQFGSDTGNVYKPTSRFLVFERDQLEKKNNQNADDWRDVQAFIAALHDTTRRSDPLAWRTALEATFDVDHFLRYLAVNNVMVNWDVYGALPQNAYLYNRPGKALTWIPWDMNEALTANSLALSLSMNEVNGTQWPLLRFLADDPVYFALYRQHVAVFQSTVFTPSRMEALLDRHHALIAPYAIGPNGEQAGATYLSDAASFTGALATLRAHVHSRHEQARTFAP
ncbi:hypothetical protein GAU_1784 [Gemmatimonas aurantiaca T-27]|uniref:Spore coat protein n=1 Tax=Gemmatimonas aurantiaca (strain DSM 14586 / JCM 11422 / NBRC 100505 / T-27) TaxID=379066 RepID=C1A401_GEMAT|nr:CotH kinase family protein [Gemmatimonas aurantiaca]BAH38826.1 hypothetical protein GAU_1784 [Gemmatimonas aurantiaca T-27]